MHVYHYAAYERTALGRLAQRHGTREEEVDRLLRGGVLVDLFRVVRQGIRAERRELLDQAPRAPVRARPRGRAARTRARASSRSRRGSSWRPRPARTAPAILRAIAGYNRDDVVSNWRLRDWLEDRRRDLRGARGRGAAAARAVGDGAALARARRARAARCRDLGARSRRASPTTRSIGRSGRRRPPLAPRPAARPGTGARTSRPGGATSSCMGMTDEELVDEREPLGRLELVADREPVGKRGRRLHASGSRPRTTAQGRAAVDDPRRSRRRDEVGVGDGRRGRRRRADGHAPARPESPAIARRTSLIPSESSEPTSRPRASCADRRRGSRRTGSTGAARPAAARDAPPAPPAAAAGAGRRRSGGRRAAARRGVRLGLGRSTDGMLPIQGPPGSGQDVHRRADDRRARAAREEGRRHGEQPQGHRQRARRDREGGAPRRGVPVRIGAEGGQGDGRRRRGRDRHRRQRGGRGGARRGDDRRGRRGTAWLWAAPRWQPARVDVLVVDEAGQISPRQRARRRAGGAVDRPARRPAAARAAASRAATRRARSAARSATCSADRPTSSPDERGLFLDAHVAAPPGHLRYTSEVFYADRLRPRAGLERQALARRPAPADGTGLRCIRSPTRATTTNRSRRPTAIAELVRDLAGERRRRGSTRDGRRARRSRSSDIVIVAPYNAHVERIERAPRAAGLRARGSARSTSSRARRRRRDLRDGELVGRGGATRHGVPVLARTG